MTADPDALPRIMLPPPPPPTWSPLLPTPDLRTALWLVQGESIQLQKDAEADVRSKTGGTGYKYTYTRLVTVHDAVLPVLTKFGLLWQTLPSVLDGEPALHYRMTHLESKEVDEATMLLMLGKGASPQDQGAAISYARRYALLAYLNLVPAETDDQNRRPAALNTAGERRRLAAAVQAGALTGRDVKMVLTKAGLAFGSTVNTLFSKVPSERVDELERALREQAPSEP